MPDARDQAADITIDLASLEDGSPALTPATGRSLAEAASVCLEAAGHATDLELTVVGRFVRTFQLHRLDVNGQMRSCFDDAEEATEFGASAIAVLVIRALTGFTIIRQSRRGIGFDYWLGSPEEQPFRKKARLEEHRYDLPFDSGLILQYPTNATNRSSASSGRRPIAPTSPSCQREVSRGIQDQGDGRILSGIAGSTRVTVFEPDCSTPSKMTFGRAWR